MEASELYLYNGPRTLPFHEQLEVLKDEWGATPEEEIFDNIRGIGCWVDFLDDSRLFIPRIPWELLQTISIGKDKFGFDNFREEDCRALIAKHGL